MGLAFSELLSGVMSLKSDAMNPSLYNQHVKQTFQRLSVQKEISRITLKYFIHHHHHIISTFIANKIILVN